MAREADSLTGDKPFPYPPGGAGCAGPVPGRWLTYREHGVFPLRYNPVAYQNA